MKNSRMKNKIVIIGCLLVAFCTREMCAFAQVSERNFARLTLDFENVVGNEPLRLQEQSYINDVGEKFNITTFNYFISNIVLHGKKSVQYIVPQDSSYFLVKGNDSSSREINLHIAPGKYTAITFTIGVDSMRSVMDISRRMGVLDISGGMLDGMYWTWNSGYIFMKLEGDCDQAEIDRTGQRKFRYHIGGFGGYDKPSINNIRTVTVDFSRAGIVKAKKHRDSKVIIKADALRIFNGKTKVSIAKNTAVMFGDFSSHIADNYSQMFSHQSTQNRLHD